MSLSFKTCPDCQKPVAADAKSCTHCSAGLTGSMGASNAWWLRLQQDLERETEGEYEVDRLIGYGGMAGVYLARDVKLGRQVALKLISPAVVTDPTMVQRFHREARTMAGLSHRHIVPIHGIHERGHLVFIDMKHVPGRTLAEVVTDAGKALPWDVVATWLAQISRALAHAHTQKTAIIHRDIKPSNVLLDEYGDAQLTDFGIAKIQGDSKLTRTHAVIGTPSYMSPEQIAGDPLTPASDQYSLGTVAYELLAGVPPFQGPTLMVLQAHTSEVAPRLSERRTDCPDQLAEVVERMLAKDPADRWNGMAEVAEQFTAAIQSPVTPATLTLWAKRVHQLAIPPGPGRLALGTSERLVARILDGQGLEIPGRRVDWASTDERIAVVSPEGVVAGKGVGSALIVAKSGKATSTLELEVLPPQVEHVPAALVGDSAPPRAGTDETVVLPVGGPATADVAATQRIRPGARPPRPRRQVPVSPKPSRSAAAAVPRWRRRSRRAQQPPKKVFWGAGAAIALIAVAWVAVQGRSDNTLTANPAVGPVILTSLHPLDTTLTSGERVSFSHDLSTVDIARVSPRWASSDTLVASIDGDGVATAKSPGTTLIFLFGDGLAELDPLVLNVLSAELPGQPVTLEAEQVVASNGPVLDDSAPEPPPAAPQRFRDIQVDPVPAEVRVGADLRLSAWLQDQDFQRQDAPDLIWTSSDPAVLQSVGSSIFRAVAAGRVTLVVSSPSARLSRSVTVTVLPAVSGAPPPAAPTPNPEPAMVRITPDGAELGAGEVQSLSATVLDGAGAVLQRPTEWASSRPDVATVDDNGTVTGAGAGAAWIVASHEGLRDSVTVTVAVATVSTTASREEYVGLVNGYLASLRQGDGGRLRTLVPGDAMSELHEELAEGVADGRFQPVGEVRNLVVTGSTATFSLVLSRRTRFGNNAEGEVAFIAEVHAVDGGWDLLSCVVAPGSSLP